MPLACTYLCNFLDKVCLRFPFTNECSNIIGDIYFECHDARVRFKQDVNPSEYRDKCFASELYGHHTVETPWIFLFLN